MKASEVKLAVVISLALAVLTTSSRWPSKGFEMAPPSEVAAGPDTEKQDLVFNTFGPAREETNPAEPVRPPGTSPLPRAADAKLVTGKVHAVNARHHKVTLKFPGGAMQTFKTAAAVDLAGVYPGARLRLQLDAGLAVSVRKLPPGPAAD